MDPVLRVKHLQTHFIQSDLTIKAVDGLSFDLGPSETLAIVGESGCGKSVTALSILRLVPDPPGRIVGGSIEFEGRDLLKLEARQLPSIRGNRIAMVFQDPMTSLNPVLTVGRQIQESLAAHLNLDRRAARRQALHALGRVRLPDPDQAAALYPHQMSGGMRQRAMIAMALACKPRILIADEPTTALDVTIQSQILSLLRELQGELQMSILLISHDLGVVAAMADRVMVMYAGKTVEEGATADVLANPRHPYTEGLLAASLGMHGPGPARGKLAEIPGMVPAPEDFPPGCAFQPRCPYSTPRCLAAPPLETLAEGRRVSCYEAGRLSGSGQ
jgi:oligopeptide/dipeptide ABC transporter ATP-binding protein